MISKKFTKGFDELLTQAYLFQSELLVDQAAFTAASPLFAPPFAANFLTDIEDADAIPTNEDDLNSQTQFTNDVEAKMVVVREHYQKLLFYVGLALPTSDTALKTFGNNLYVVARNTPHKMINLLQSSYITANSTTYKADLIAAGFLQVDITLIDTLAGELTAIYNDQQNFIMHVYKRSEERIVAFNKVWDSMVMISNASKLIFKTSPAKIEFYLLYPDTSIIGPLTPVAGLIYNMYSQRFNWTAQVNATSYSLEVSVNGVDFVEVYAGPDTEFYYSPADLITRYRCRARNAGGFGDYSPVVIVTYSSTLDYPRNVTANYTTSPNVMHLNWDAVTGADHYVIYGCEVPVGGNPTVLTSRGTPATNSYNESILLNKRYFYAVFAVDGTEISPPCLLVIRDTI